MTAPKQSRINLTTVLKEFLICYGKARVSNFCYSIKVKNKYRDKKGANILMIYKIFYYDTFIATKKLILNQKICHQKFN